MDEITEVIIQTKLKRTGDVEISFNKDGLKYTCYTEGIFHTYKSSWDELDDYFINKLINN